MNPPITTRREMVPSTARNLQLVTDPAAVLPPVTKTSPVALGGGLVQNLVADPALRQQILADPALRQQVLNNVLPHATDLHSGMIAPHAHTKPLAHLSGSTAVPLPGPGARGVHLGRGDNPHASFSSDDLALNKQIVATHAGDFDSVELNVRPVLAIIEDIFVEI